MAATIVGPVNVASGLPGGSSAALNVTAAQVIKAAPGILAKVSCIVGGTLTLNDLAVNSGAAAANEIAVLAMTAGQVQPLDWPCATGILASAVSAGQFSVAFT